MLFDFSLVLPFLIIVALLLSPYFVGPRSQADGPGTLGMAGQREGKTGELIVTQLHGKYYEDTHRGNRYAAMTATTGVSIASLSQGTTGPSTIANPKGSGKRVVIERVSMGYVSGTYGAGNLTYSVNSNVSAAAVTGTACTPVNLDVGSSNNAVAQVFTTSTLPAAPTPIRNFANLDAALATTTNPPANMAEDLEGDIVLEPGTSCTISGTTAAGSSPLVVVSWQWKEVPII